MVDIELAALSPTGCLKRENYRDEANEAAKASLVTSQPLPLASGIARLHQSLLWADVVREPIIRTKKFIS